MVSISLFSFAFTFLLIEQTEAGMVEKWTKEVLASMEAEKVNEVKREKLKQMREHTVRVHEEKHRRFQEHLKQVLPSPLFASYLM